MKSEDVNYLTDQSVHTYRAATLGKLVYVFSFVIISEGEGRHCVDRKINKLNNGGCSELNNRNLF